MRGINGESAFARPLSRFLLFASHSVDGPIYPYANATAGTGAVAATDIEAGTLACIAADITADIADIAETTASNTATTPFEAISSVACAATDAQLAIFESTTSLPALSRWDMPAFR
jgi:hypothetical protein